MLEASKQTVQVRQTVVVRGAKVKYMFVGMVRGTMQLWTWQGGSHGPGHGEGYAEGWGEASKQVTVAGMFRGVQRAGARAQGFKSSTAVAGLSYSADGVGGAQAVASGVHGVKASKAAQRGALFGHNPALQGCKQVMASEGPEYRQEAGCQHSSFPSLHPSTP